MLRRNELLERYKNNQMLCVLRGIREGSLETRPTPPVKIQLEPRQTAASGVTDMAPPRGHDRSWVERTWRAQCPGSRLERLHYPGYPPEPDGRDIPRYAVRMRRDV